MKLQWFFIPLLMLSPLFAFESESVKKGPCERVKEFFSYDCEIDDAYFYGALGLGPLPVPIPTFSLGYRTQHNHFGRDLSLQLATIGIITQVKANLLFPYYFKPNPFSQFYMEAGLSVGGFFSSKKSCRGSAFTLSPEIVFGKKYNNDVGDGRFFQCQISWPTFPFGSFSSPLYFPLVVLSYGVCF